MSQPVSRGCESGDHRFIAIATSTGSYLVCKACGLRQAAPADRKDDDPAQPPPS